MKTTSKITRFHLNQKLSSIIAKLSKAKAPVLLSFSLILKFSQPPPTHHLTGKVFPSIVEFCSSTKLPAPATADWVSSPRFSYFILSAPAYFKQRGVTQASKNKAKLGLNWVSAGALTKLGKKVLTWSFERSMVTATKILNKRCE